MAQPNKSLIFVGSAKDDIRGFPKDARGEIGYTLYSVQCNEPLSDLEGVKSFVSIGPGVYEISTRTGQQGLDHRTFFVAKFAEAVYVLHAFEKRQQKTPPKEIALAKARYRSAIEVRKDQKKAKKK